MMAQCVGAFWCRGSLHRQLTWQLFRSKADVFSSITVPSFLPRTAWEDMMLPRLCVEGTTDTSRVSGTYSAVVCFRDDDAAFPEYLVERNWSSMSARANLEIHYSPWAVEMMNGFGKNDEAKPKESTGGPPGSGKGGDDGGGRGGGGGGDDDDDDDDIFLLPMLTLTFAAFHLGYCIAIWLQDDSLDFEFFQTGLGLFALLAVSALRLNARTGIDAYVLGLGASVGVMVWTGERCLVKREGHPAGVVALFAASMAVMFTAALYHTF